MHDLADIIVRLCSHVCGQGRCFAVDGQALPVCQRCLGLYAGGAFTLVWLILSGLWRNGLPSRGVFAIQCAVLLVAGLGGWHVIDTGPRWRLACGLFTGYVTTYWLAVGIVCLWQNARLGDATRGTAVSLAEAQAIVMPMLLGMLAAFCGRPAFLGWWPLTMIACLGIMAVWSLSVTAMVLLMYRALARARILLFERRQP